MMGLLWRSKRAISSDVLAGKRKGLTGASPSASAPSNDHSATKGTVSTDGATADGEADNLSVLSARRIDSPLAQRATGAEIGRSEEDVHRSSGATDDDFLAAVRGLEVHRSSPSNEADISVPLSNADVAVAPATITRMPSQFDPAVSSGDRPLDASDTADAPSLSLTLGPAHGHSQAGAHAAPRQGESCEIGDAPSLTLRVPSSAQRASTGTLYNQPSLTPNPRAPADCDVLEAPSLRLPHVEGPIHQACSMDAEFNAHFTFPDSVANAESSSTAALDVNMHAPPPFGHSAFHELSPDCPAFHAAASPVHAAAQEGNESWLRELLQAVPDPDSLWCDSGSPLHSAVQGGSPGCVQVLLNAGAAIDCINGDGITPLMLAAVMGEEDVMLLLLEHDADICKAFLPGSSEGLLHFCVEHEMVRGLKAILAKPDGQLLATSTRLKPIYAALMSLAEVCTPVPSPTGGSRGAPSPGKVAAAASSPVITKAKSVVDLLLAHSDLPANASYDDLIQHAHASYTAMETLGGSSADDLDCMLSSADRRSSASPAAFDPESGRASSRHSGKRLVFTPTANLDCSPANCSPLSVFGSERSYTPSAGSRLGNNGSLPAEVSSPLLAGSASVGHSSSVGGFDTPRTPTASALEPGQPAVLPQRLFPKKPLRVRTRIPE